MNMVRAGAVSHPAQWPWCGHDELTGRRSRYRILAIDRLLGSLDLGDADCLFIGTGGFNAQNKPG